MTYVVCGQRTRRAIAPRASRLARMVEFTMRVSTEAVQHSALGGGAGGGGVVLGRRGGGRGRVWRGGVGRRGGGAGWGDVRRCAGKGGGKGGGGGCVAGRE